MITVVGDIIIDEYLYGTVVGPNPEVVGGRKIRVFKRELKLGGAAAVAAMMMTYGKHPLLTSVLSNDRIGDWAMAELCAKNVRSEICRDPMRVASVKTRILVDNQIQPDRLDVETLTPISDEHAQRVYTHIRGEPNDVVVLVDYGKGVLTDNLVHRIVSLNKITRSINFPLGIPIIVDPAMGLPWSRYKGATLIKANVLEAIAELGQSYPVRMMAQLLSAQHNCQIIITDGERGMAWADFCGRRSGYVPANKVTVVDPTGCGDTVVAAVAMRAGGPLPEVCEFAVAEAAKCVGRLGVL